jgi:hypothetical protein
LLLSNEPKPKQEKHMKQSKAKQGVTDSFPKSDSQVSISTANEIGYHNTNNE